MIKGETNEVYIAVSRIEWTIRIVVAVDATIAIRI